jgi:alpha-ketoglutarate-dependent taurine dioxygenase
MANTELPSLSPTFGGIVDAAQTALEEIDVGAMLAQRGALLFRGFAFDLEGFKQFSRQHSGEFSDYEGGAFRAGALNRQTIGGDPTVLTTTGHSQGFPISLHGEMHYLKHPPEILWFYCERPSATDGQTTLCDGRTLWNGLSPEAQAYFRATKICYSRHLEDGDWQTTFGTESLDRVAQICARESMEWSYDENTRTVTTRYICDALREGEVFINNILPVLDGEWAYSSGWVEKNLASEKGKAKPPLMVRAEDGSPIPDDVLQSVKKSAKAHTIDLNWQAGDVCMVDNLRVMHGRRQATDSNRSILVRMGSARPVSVTTSALGAPSA